MKLYRVVVETKITTINHFYIEAESEAEAKEEALGLQLVSDSAVPVSEFSEVVYITDNDKQLEDFYDAMNDLWEAQNGK